MAQIVNIASRWAFTTLTLVLLIAPLSQVLAAQTKTNSVPQELKGEWVIRSFYSTPNVWGLSLKQAKSLIGSKLVYANRTLSACKQHVAISTVEESEVSSAQFLAGTYVRFKYVGITGTSIPEFVLNGNSGGNCFATYALPGEDVYLKSPNELLIDFESVYFRATRARSHREAK